MSVELALQFVPTFVLAFFRVAGMMLAAPFFGNARVPRRIRLMLALVLTVGFLPGIGPVRMPDSTWLLAAGIAGEMLFGLAIGTVLNFAFMAVQWAGEIISQQLGLGLGEMYDPQFGQGGSVVSDLYFLLTLVIFLSLQGHHAFLRGVRATFDSLPLLSVGMSQGLLDLAVGLLASATNLAMQLAAPMLVTMLLVDVVLGFVGKTIPQINVMTAGLSLRSLVGIVVMILGLALTGEVIAGFLKETVKALGEAWAAPI